MHQLMRWVVLGGTLALSACSSGRAAYLDDQVGKAMQQHIQEDLGRPDHTAMKDGGQSVWLYEDCLMPGTCSIWSLTFDRTHILRAWHRSPEHA